MITLEIEKIGHRKPWVARITGTDPKYGLARDFLDADVDYTHSNRPGTRGINYSFELDDGIYEIKGGKSWGSAGTRSFLRVAGESSEQIDMAAALEFVRGGKVGAS